MTAPETPETPGTPAGSHWSGIQRQGGMTGVPRFPWSGITRTVTGRRLLLQVSLVFLATLAGYLVAALWLYPAPLFDETRAVPRVLEMPVAQAEQTLTDAGFRVKREGELSHPRLPAGAVVWQDPPPYTELGTATTVTLMVSDGPADRAVPDVEGMDAPLALRVLQAAGLPIQGVDSVANAAPKGTALATRPASGVARNRNDRITLVVSAGPASTAIPDVSGLTVPDARERLFDAGLTIGRITTESNPGVPAGRIVRQRPAAGGLAAKDGRVDVVVAGEPQ
ncbi:MAG TPA: PASTA domain-containing protein [Gemmatimonadales bacterium]|nr:PASTA domain-containing protein [Gemmatimonadales bacterium]